MPPKKGKGAADHVPAILGRLSSSLRVGIVGMPNVGKSSLFNVMCEMEAAAENFPFCTVKENVARCKIEDERFDWLVDHYEPATTVATYLNVHDIAGLVKGAHNNEGLGNEFLSKIRATDAIFHLVRVFSDEEIAHVEGTVDPIRDMEIIHDELRMKDVEFIKNKIGAVTPGMLSSDKKLAAEFKTLGKILEILESGKAIIECEWDNHEVEVLNDMQLLTSLPHIYLVNMSEHDFLRKRNKWLGKIMAFVKSKGDGKWPMIPLSVPFEAKIAALTQEDREAYCKEKNAHSQLQKIAQTGYTMLNLIHFFTSLSNEIKCWTIRRGTTAVKAAGRIHTDMEVGFIMAEIMSFADLKECGNDANVRAAGKLHMCGKAHVVEDGDIIHFKFKAPPPSKKK